ncbi:hypothetical protein Tco_0339113 [Tanacetum coccineum]
MVRIVSIEEVKGAIFDMGNDKSPGPDGYMAAFFKEAWDIMGLDEVKAVREFFSSGKILKELNHTIIALIPKVSSPSRINEYRPISCCNVLFKCITKIISNRLKGCLKDLHLDRGPPRCAFKLDIQKAYDTVDWRFLKSILIGFGFHMTMVEWIMECVSSTSFSLNINGVLHGYFKGKCGLRQGDPLYPYLFTLVMEVLTLMLKRHVRDSNEFTFHKKCADLGIVNLCFTDDLFLFAYGDVNSASVIMFALEEFKNASGLVPSLPKSTAYFCNVLNHVKLAILNVMPFEEGSLPVKYLGLPLVSSRLVYRDCKELMVKVQDRIGDWKNNFLSFVGRLQLTQSVISSMHIYWASMFILPSRIVSDIEQLMRGFLWCQGPMKRGKAKVSWESVCLPKIEGGLGLRRLALFNVALISYHIWSLITLKESLWVQWIHTHKLRGRSFWDISYSGNMTWGWRKILQSDVIMWKDRNDEYKPFSVREVWHAIRPKEDVDVGDNIDVNSLLCPLCDLQPDSHPHLFFVCPFSNYIWDIVKTRAGIMSNSVSFDGIVAWLIPLAKKRSVRSIVSRLLLVASTYYIWQERNGRIFKKRNRSKEQIGALRSPRRELHNELKMTNTQTPPPATTVVNTTGAPVTNTVANHAERPEKFNGQNFKRWQQIMFFYLTTLGLALFLKETVPQVEPPAEGQSSNAQVVQAVEAWKHSDFLCHNYVLNGLIDPLYNVYYKTTTAKELWESLERKYKTEDAAVAIIKKLPPSWVDFKNYLKHKRKEMSVEDLVVRLRIEEDNRLAQKDIYTPDSAKANLVEHVGSSSRSNPKGKGKDKWKNDKKSKGKSEYLAPKAGIMKQKLLQL